MQPTHHNHLLYITQEVQTDLMLLRVHGVDVPISLSRQADRLGGLIYGLLRTEARGQDS
jgi:hypothetical protein